MRGAANVNPFESPAVASCRRCPDRYPKTVCLAQVCGLALALFMLSESYTFPRPDVPWPHIMFWGAIITMVATASLVIPSWITALLPLLYFQTVGLLSLMIWIVAWIAPIDGSFFFLVVALLCIVVIIALTQKPTETYYDGRSRRQSVRISRRAR